MTAPLFLADVANKQVGDVTDAAAREPVVLTRHRKPRFVLMSYDHYERMRTGGDPRQAHRASRMPGEHEELFGAPITIMRSHSPAIALTASCRFDVA